MAKKSLWYQRGFTSANREDWVQGKETPALMRAFVGDRFNCPLHRYPKNAEQFNAGYWDSIESQRPKKTNI